MAGMRIGLDFRRKINSFMSSWKSASDPSTGDYSLRFDFNGDTEMFLWEGNTTKIWRTGPWEGTHFSGIPDTTSYQNFSFSYVSDDRGTTYSFMVTDPSIISRLVVNHTGVVQRSVWIDDGRGDWNYLWYAPRDPCDALGACGAYGVCDPNNSPICGCMQGFEPRYPANWVLRDGGCVRKTKLDCKNGTDGFATVSGVKLPESGNCTVDREVSLVECRSMCLSNCSCTGYAAANVSGGVSGCVIWVNEMTDVRVYTAGQDLYVRLAAADLVESFHHIKGPDLIIICVVIPSVLILFISVSIFWLRQRKGKRNLNQLEISLAYDNYHDHEVNGYGERTDDKMNDHNLDHGLLQFTFSTITTCTNNFSDENKIGEGGFGPVYKGILSPKGQEIAIKRLSRGSIQGVDEFKNEIKLIANLQHKNLVRLLGCCIKDEERILVYEYMPNKSLDCFLFDPIRAATLDWKTRIQIIHGVAQGLLYLHTYSRLRIIHRDLKSGNILLDSEMNPKISDFGIARIFGGNQVLASTSTVVGTYGYMPPEYALEGWFSEKSDVFSFGVLLLEIVSGKRNYGAPQVGGSRFLTGYVWSLWKAGCVPEIMDPVLRESCPLQDLLRYVHVGLLCVQDEASERPNMSTIISFLSSDISKLPKPEGVAFFNQRKPGHLEEFCYSNELTITAPRPL